MIVVGKSYERERFIFVTNNAPELGTCFSLQSMRVLLENKVFKYDDLLVDRFYEITFIKRGF